VTPERCLMAARLSPPRSRFLDEPTAKRRRPPASNPASVVNTAPSKGVRRRSPVNCAAVAVAYSVAACIADNFT
jgi:hypothetical protein